MDEPTGNIRSPALSVLQRAPGRLSARAVERALGLPSGAWQRRRLYALRARSRAFEDIGIRRGDSLIVEPGERLRPAQLVIVKESDRISVRLCDSLGSTAEPLAEQASLLPFMKIRTRVIGTVVGILRRDERAQLCAVPLPVPRSGVSGDRRTRNRRRACAEVARSAHVDGLERRLRNWDLWTEHHRDELRTVSESLPACCDDLQKSLATLLECMRNSRGHRLFRALSQEALRVCDEMEQVRSKVRRNVRHRLRHGQVYSPLEQPAISDSDSFAAAGHTSPEGGTPPTELSVRSEFDTMRAGMI